MEKRIVFIILFIVLFISGGVYLVVDRMFSDGSSEDAYPDSSSNKLVSGIGIESIVEYSPDTIAVHYPVTPSFAVNDKINKMVSEELDKFRALAKLKKDDEDNYEFFITFETGRYKSKILSFRFEIFESSPLAANPQFSIKTMMFDMDTEREISLGELVGVDDYLKVLSDKAYEYFIEQEMFEDEYRLKDGLEPIPENFENFAIIDGNLEISFDEYQLGPRSLGRPLFSVSMNEIEILIAP